jgi:hypothetical protein
MGALTAPLPSYIAVGPTRTATTWLHQVLEGHIGLPAGIKETQFFVWNYNLGLTWYRSHFRNCLPHLPVMEIAPTCFDAPEALDRIKLHIPECKIICTLRDPVERAWSHYKHWQQRGLIKAPFAEAAFTHDQIVSAGRYADHIRAWQNAFGVANVMILLYDDLRADRQRYLDSLTAFLGIAPINLAHSPVTSNTVNRADRMPYSHRSARRARKFRDTLIRRRFHRLIRLGEPLFQVFFNGGAPYPPLDRALELRLRRHLEPEVTKLEHLLKRDLSSWKTGPRRSSEDPGRNPREAQAESSTDTLAGLTEQIA